MKLGCQIGLLPEKDLKEKFEIAKEIGFEGIEVWGRELLEDRRKVEEYVKCSESSGIKIYSICAGYRNFLLESEPENRKKAREEIKELLEIGKELGAVGLILVPIFGDIKLQTFLLTKMFLNLKKNYCCHSFLR